MALAGVLLQAGNEVVNSSTSYYAGGGGAFWLALALINAAIAQLHGRRGLNWFLISILFGPFATLILVLQYKRP